MAATRRSISGEADRIQRVRGSRSRSPRRAFSRSLAFVVCVALATSLGGAPVVSASGGGLPGHLGVLNLVRVSVDSDGNQADSSSSYPSISANGRYVAFVSSATNLVDGDTNNVQDVFVRNMQTGAIERVSVRTDGTEGNNSSANPSISADGRYVTFSSVATNLVDGDTNNVQDVFVHDRQTGVTERVSVSSDGTQGNGFSRDPSISGDGRYVAFSSVASNLVADDTNDVQDVFVHDRQTGLTERVSVDSDGAQANGYSGYPAITADGRQIAFESRATNLVEGDTNGETDIFVHYRHTKWTVRVSLGADGAEGNGGSLKPAISADGRFVAFESLATNLVEGNTNGEYDIFVRDRHTNTTERVSVHTDGTEANNYSSNPSISADGRFVAFSSYATNLVDNDTTSGDIFVRDRETGVTGRASVRSDGTQANEESLNPSISADGRFVAFSSLATNLVDDDTMYGDVFVAELTVLPPVLPVAGTDRYATAIEASKLAYPQGLYVAGSRTVVIATGMNWPDALGGTALAGAVDGPILLVGTNTMPAGVLAEIERLGAEKAIILGGTSAVGLAVQTALETALEGADNVDRIAGTDRYETANEIALRVIELLEDDYDGTAFVATGGNFPDALAAAPLAAAQKWPLYLADPATGLSPATVDAMEDVTDVLILGGTAVVSPQTEAALETLLGTANVDRLSGADRYKTAVAVATHAVDEAGHTWNRVGIATGENFPDALAGGVLQGKAGSVMLLTPSATLNADTAAALLGNSDDIVTVTFFGGTGAVSDAVRTAALAAAGVVP